jgi:hypothetical protein
MGRVAIVAADRQHAALEVALAVARAPSSPGLRRSPLPILALCGVDGWHLPSMPAFPILTPGRPPFKVWTEKDAQSTLGRHEARKACHPPSICSPTLPAPSLAALRWLTWAGFVVC